jgi:ABC-2 type transport system permease protein
LGLGPHPSAGRYRPLVGAVNAFGIYRRLIGVQIRSQLEYRTAFVMDLAAVAAGTAMEFVTLALVMTRFGTVGGWNLGEIAFLYGMVEAAFGTMDMLFSGFDYDTFGPMVRRGQFDQLLLRPVNITLQVLGSKFALRRLSRIAQGLVVLVYGIVATGLRWTPLKVVYLPLVYVSLVCFFGGLFVTGSTTTFWTVQRIEVLNIFTYGGTVMMSYPMHIYRDWMRRFFTYVVPAVFLNYYPALYFLDKPDPLGMPPFAPYLAPLVGLGTLSAALLFWRYGIRHYASTGT